MDDVDYLVENYTRDDFAYHRKWMGPKVGCTMTVQAGNQNTNVGNDSSNSEETQQSRVSPLFEKL